MESAGAEPFSAHKPLFQSADGGAGRYAHLSGNLSHPVFLLSLAGRADAHRMLAAADVDDQSCCLPSWIWATGFISSSCAAISSLAR